MKHQQEMWPSIKAEYEEFWSGQKEGKKKKDQG